MFGPGVHCERRKLFETTLDQLQHRQLQKGAERLISTYARKNNFKIDPLCAYAAKQFERHEDYRDVRVQAE